MPSDSTTWKLQKHLNFYRIHIIFFTFTPLIFSAIFYGSNGEQHVSYIDSLFNCISAMTVCGLATLDLSSITPWQQVILFVQMCLGSPVLISWVMVYMRRLYFARKFEHIIRAAADRKARLEAAQLTAHETMHSVRSRRTNTGKSTPWPQGILNKLLRKSTRDKSAEDGNSPDEAQEKPHQQVRPDMIRRMDDAPKLVNPSGWISEGSAAPARQPFSVNLAPLPEAGGRQLVFADRTPAESPDVSELPPARSSRPLSDAHALSRPDSPVSIAPSMHRFETVHTGHGTPMNRTQTVEFAPIAPTVNRRRRLQSDAASYSQATSIPEAPRMRRGSIGRYPSMQTHGTSHTGHTGHTGTHRSLHATKNSGFGGFPMPHEIVHSLIKRFTPNLRRTLTQTLTVPRTMTIASQRGSISQGVKPVPYITFEAVVGRNSTFHLLTREQQEELGGVEYRALNALLYIVAAYHIGVQALAFIVIVPYMYKAKWSQVFLPPQQHKPISPVWFSLYQVVSSYTNTGMSLVDQSMVPFQKAYPMVFFMMFLILAGNTAFPIFLRFTIWVLSKLVSKSSRTHETLHFLLDHPRRCFIYLFPSHQTWFLLTIVVTLNITDWFFFIVLDIGNPATEYVPIGTRFVIGLLQAIAVRAAGFGLVVLAQLAPAVKVLYVVMMYISVYPIAMSVRSTNVYEEQSLGVFHDDEGSESEEDFSPAGSRVQVWSRYLTMHARKQLSFDMWWLGLALFLVCIIERNNIENTDNLSWFNIFNVVFELVSAYGSVGLSLGSPTTNYSFSGSFRPLSKLIVCFVMIRGRHRGLPVAIDRAVMLPQEYGKDPEDESDEDHRSGYEETARPDIHAYANSVKSPQIEEEPELEESTAFNEGIIKEKGILENKTAGSHGRGINSEMFWDEKKDDPEMNVQDGDAPR